MIIDGKKLADSIKQSLKKIIIKNNISTTLAVIQIGENEASNIYIKQKKKISEEIGINFLHIKFNNDENINSIKSKIMELNSDKNVSGIIIQLPIPNNFLKEGILNLIDAEKDVDGLTSNNKIKLLNNEDCFVPCTPLAVIELLKYYNISLEGKNVVIVGRSSLVSKPLFNLLINMNATVTMCHSKTNNLSLYTKSADIIVSATGVKHLIKKEMIKKDVVIIDIGINRESGKICGDVDFENIKELASFITPVPRGVGPMTVIMLMKNTLKKLSLSE